MKYLEFTFRTSPCTEVVNDVLSAILGDAGFESFVEQEGGIAAYIQKDLYDETTVKAAIDEFPLPDTQIEYTFTEAEDKDWNEEWEKNFFQPIVIGDRCIIHSTFHHDVPRTEYDIVINPQMAFGTGHHETTSLPGTRKYCLRGSIRCFQVSYERTIHQYRWQYKVLHHACEQEWQGWKCRNPYREGTCLVGHCPVVPR